MTMRRIELALEQGLATLPAEGRIGVWRPRGDFAPGPLPPGRLHLIQGFRPDHDRLRAAGHDVGIEPIGDYAAGVVFITRSREQTRGLVAEALARLLEGAVLLVDGQKTDGIESILRDVRKAGLEVTGVISKAHGKLFAVRAPAGLPASLRDWVPEPVALPGGMLVMPGVFSVAGPDRGSEILLETIPGTPGARIADLGAGWGHLAADMLQREGVEEVHLVEAEHLALELARRNIADPRARFHWADATAWRPEAPLDAIVTNPPHHAGRRSDPTLGQGFIRAAARMLRPKGMLWLVANRHLPYEDTLRENFREVEQMADREGFKVMRAAGPLPAARPGAPARARRRTRR